MKPILFSSTETAFTSNGLGVLTDTAECYVEETRNEGFELELQYPVSGIHFEDLRLRNIIFAKPSPTRRAQPFRIYRITKPMDGIVTVYAQHISYDLIGIPVSPFEASTAAQAIAGLNSHKLVNHPFTFSTDKVRNGDFASAIPAAIRSVMGGRDGSILDIYHGEWLYDLFSVQLKEARGADNGVKILYGKNLTKLEQDENISEVYTGVLPYWYSENDGLVQGTIQNVPGTFDFVRILTKDFSDKYNEAPTAAALNADAAEYIRDNEIGVPKVSLTLSYVDLSKASGFESMAALEAVELCDIVTVEFEKLGITATAKVISTRFDVLLERYSEIEVGDAKETLTDTIAAQAMKLKAAPTKSDMQKAIDYATQLITGNHGGYVIFHDSDGDNFPDEILIMDTPDIETARKVWRWNQSGLGYSGTGYRGPYGLAMTIDGSIVANYITTGTLNAENVNVTNINGENIRNKTIGESPMKDYAISYGKTSAGVQSTLTQVGINTSDISLLWVEVDKITARLASFQQALASSITTGSLTINRPSFYYNGAKMTFIGFTDDNGNYHEVLGYY